MTDEPFQIPTVVSRESTTEKYEKIEKTVWSDGCTTYRARRRSSIFTQWTPWFDCDESGWMKRG